VPKRHNHEDLLQINVVRHLRDRFPGRVFYASVNQKGTRSNGEQIKLHDMGLLAGVPDLELMLGDGRVGYIELKYGRGRQTKAQKAFEAYCKANGYPYALCHDQQQAVEAAENMWREA